MNTSVVNVHNPNFVNCIFGQSHFIKTVEDLHEVLVSSVPNIQFGLAFCEASGERLIRTSGTNADLIKLATENAETIGCGHTFIIFLGNAFPINVLSAIKAVPEVVNVYCATANALQVIVAETNQGRGVMGVIDGESPLGVETEAGIIRRKEFIRKIGYKLS